MNEECLICKSPLEYISEAVVMKCSICGAEISSQTRCVKGHFVCDRCHTTGMDSIFGVCMSSDSRDPVMILEQMMSLPFCHMHGPEHHVMVGAALLTAYRNAGGDIVLEAALKEMYRRGQQVPGGACGFWGACGAGVSTGMFVSIVTGSSPLAGEAWGMSNLMTSRALGRISETGGPRCCKRDSYLAITEAVVFVREKLGIEMQLTDIRCSRSDKNNQCLKERCPFYG